MTMRAITFPTPSGYAIDGRVPYLNRETGVAVLKRVVAGLPTQWEVIAPAHHSDYDRILYTGDTRSECFVFARAYVANTARDEIAKAYAEAEAEDTARTP